MKKSFSLIEVLIFVTILSIFLVAAASIVTVSMRRNTTKINMLKAVHYNEQLLEWIGGEKEAEWKQFITHGNSVGMQYCFSSDSLDWSGSGECGGYLGGIYRRYATVKNSGDPVSRVEVSAHTEWEEGENTYSKELTTVFTLWE